MDNPQNSVIKYFGFGTNCDIEMMAHMVGRDNIRGESGKLLGYELGTLKAKRFCDDIPENSPVDISARAILLNSWGPDFDMYVSRPNPNGVIYGTIWDITPEELELVREWELVDYGAQEDAWGTAVNIKGKSFKVITQSFMRPPAQMDKVLADPDYEPYIAPKATMLKRSDESRLMYLERKKNTKSV